jgi:hypothetical protein
MRDLLNILDSVLTEVTISKAKYGAGTQFAVATGSQNGQALLQLMQQQGFDATAPLTMQDTSELGDQEILNLPNVAVGKGGDGYLFSNPAGQYILVTGTSSAIGPCFNVYNGAQTDDPEDVGKIGNRGETSEGILGAAMFAKFVKREPGEDIGTVTPADIGGVLDSLKKTGQDQYEVEVEDYDNEHADRITFVLRLKTGPYQDLMDPTKRTLLAREYSSAAAYVNSSDAERYSRYFYINGRADQITIMADGVTGETEQKTDVWVYVADEDGNPRKLRLNTSLKVGGIGQFGQVSGDSEQTQQTLWNYFGVNIDSTLAAFRREIKAGRSLFDFINEMINPEGGFKKARKKIMKEWFGGIDKIEGNKKIEEGGEKYKNIPMPSEETGEKDAVSFVGASAQNIKPKWTGGKVESFYTTYENCFFKIKIYDHDKKDERYFSIIARRRS